MSAYSMGSSPSPGRSAVDFRWQRIHRLLMPAAAIVLLSVGHVAAQEAPDPDPLQMSAPAKASRNGKVCQLEGVTGSRMKKRVCYTPQQWEAREAAAKAMVRELDGKSIPKDANGG